MLLISLGNYLIAYQPAFQQIKEAFEENMYMRYGAKLTVVFVGVTVVSLCPLYPCGLRPEG